MIVSKNSKISEGTEKTWLFHKIAQNGPKMLIILRLFCFLHHGQKMPLKASKLKFLKNIDHRPKFSSFSKFFWHNHLEYLVGDNGRIIFWLSNAILETALIQNFKSLAQKTSEILDKTSVTPISRHPVSWKYLPVYFYIFILRSTHWVDLWNLLLIKYLF